ncbi:unnamed protein product [Symbiodinium sp. CCMP2456]|nr:unnamed protein product [Symbiodinium sp. CCMP2456]
MLCGIGRTASFASEFSAVLHVQLEWLMRPRFIVNVNLQWTLGPQLKMICLASVPRGQAGLQGDKITNKCIDATPGGCLRLQSCQGDALHVGGDLSSPISRVH